MPFTREPTLPTDPTGLVVLASQTALRAAAERDINDADVGAALGLVFHPSVENGSRS